MDEACEREGRPQDAAPCIHVAGTNGKGSVSASLEAIARAGGIRTGLYTSPHLVRFAERIRLDGAPIDDQLLARELAYVLDVHPELTFFEVATMVAFRAFRSAGVELTILEVGLGGRLDATNVVSRSLTTAITSIGLDHTAILGETLGAIAREKAGICRSGVPLMVGVVPAEARAVIDGHAAEVGALQVWHAGEDLVHRRTDEGLVVESMSAEHVVVHPTLLGAHQDRNAAIAIGAIWLARTRAESVLAARLNDAAIVSGLASVRWPGRLEELIVAEGALAGRYLLDGAHNEEGALALATALASMPDARSTRALVFGAMADKPWSTMTAPLIAQTSTRFYVAPNASGGGRPAADPRALAEADAQGEIATSAVEALGRARANVGPEGTVVVAGSLYLVGEVRSLLTGEVGDPHVGL